MCLFLTVLYFYSGKHPALCQCQKKSLVVELNDFHSVDLTFVNFNCFDESFWKASSDRDAYKPYSRSF